MHSETVKFTGASYMFQYFRIIMKRVYKTLKWK